MAYQPRAGFSCSLRPSCIGAGRTGDPSALGIGLKLRAGGPIAGGFRSSGRPFQTLRRQKGSIPQPGTSSLWVFPGQVIIARASSRRFAEARRPGRTVVQNAGFENYPPPGQSPGWRKTVRWTRRTGKSPGVRHGRCLVWRQNLGTTPAATRALRRPRFRIDSGIAF